MSKRSEYDEAKRYFDILIRWLDNVSFLTIRFDDRSARQRIEMVIECKVDDEMPMPVGQSFRAEPSELAILKEPLLMIATKILIEKQDAAIEEAKQTLEELVRKDYEDKPHENHRG